MLDDAQTITVKELKTVIETLEWAAETDEWVPSHRQWKRIRELISKLDDTVAVAPPVMVPYPANPPTPPWGVPVWSDTTAQTQIPSNIAIPSGSLDHFGPGAEQSGVLPTAPASGEGSYISSFK